MVGSVREVTVNFGLPASTISKGFGFLNDPPIETLEERSLLKLRGGGGDAWAVRTSLNVRAFRHGFWSCKLKTKKTIIASVSIKNVANRN